MNETWDNLKLQGHWNIHRMAVNAIQFSPDKRYLASGDEEGLLAVREMATNKCIRLFKAKVVITCVRWDPSKPSLIFFGLSNGEVNKVKISPKGAELDDKTLETVDGWIHDLCVNDAGTRVFVAQGNRVVTAYRDSLEKDWGPLTKLSIPRVEDGIHPLVCQLHWSKDLLIVCFFFQGLGAIAYRSDLPFSEKWRLKTRKQTVIGGSALSPSGKRLVIFNMFDGLDWYGTSNRKLLSTTQFSIEAHRFTDLVLIDEETVIVGHALGAVLIATFDGINSQVVRYITCLETYDPIQTLACAIIDGKLTIAGGSTPIANPTATMVLITEDIRDSDNKERRSKLRKCAYCLIQSVIIITALATILVIAFPPLKPETPTLTMNPGSSLSKAPQTVVVTETKTETATASRIIFKTKLETTTVTQTDAITLTVTDGPVMQGALGTATVTQTDAVVLTVTETQTIKEVQGTVAAAQVEAVTQTVTELQALIVTHTEAAKTITTTVTLVAPHTLPPGVAAPSGLDNTTAYVYQFWLVAFCAVAILVGWGVSNPSAVLEEDASSCPDSCSAQKELQRIRERMVMADVQETHPTDHEARDDHSIVPEDHPTEVRGGQPDKARDDQVQEDHFTEMQADQPAEVRDRSNVHEGHVAEVREGPIAEWEETGEDMSDVSVEVQVRPAALRGETKGEEAHPGENVRVDQGGSRAEAAEEDSCRGSDVSAIIEPEGEQTAAFRQGMTDDSNASDVPVDIRAEEGSEVAEGHVESASEGAILPDEATNDTQPLAGPGEELKVVDGNGAEIEIEAKPGELVEEDESDDDDDTEKTVTSRHGKTVTVGESKSIRRAERLIKTQAESVTNTKAPIATKPTKTAPAPKVIKKQSGFRATDPTSAGKGLGWK